MKEKTFRTLFAAVTGACLAATVAHFIYAIQAYLNCSIIEFIAGELW